MRCIFSITEITSTTAVLHIYYYTAVQFKVFSHVEHLSWDDSGSIDGWLFNVNIYSRFKNDLREFENGGKVLSAAMKTWRKKKVFLVRSKVYIVLCQAEFVNGVCEVA